MPDEWPSGSPIRLFWGTVNFLTPGRGDNMRGFYNDDDGLSITETLALVFSGVYVLVVIVMLAALMRGRLADLHVDFLSVCSWPVLTILAGYFGDRVASRFGGVPRRSGARRPAPVMEETDEPAVGELEPGPQRPTI